MSAMNILLHAVLSLVLLPLGLPVPASEVPTPTFRVEAAGFNAREADIRTILRSTAQQLWQHFPDHQIEPIVVTCTPTHTGPITLLQRNPQGEIVVYLDTQQTYWSQYAYQFAHEFCHVLCAARNIDHPNMWFEETLCETASLYTMRSMSRSWRNAPPSPILRDYRDDLRDYADTVIRSREKDLQVYQKGLPAFYRLHQGALEKNPNGRDLNGAMAIILLRLFEEQPQHWEAVRWLNTTAPKKGDSFQTYLQNWHNAAPPKHQAFIRQIGELFNVSIQAV